MRYFNVKRQITFTIYAMALWGCARNHAHRVGPLTKQEESAERIKHHVEKFGAIGPKNIENDEAYKRLQKIATYIKDQLKDMGYKVNVYKYIACYKLYTDDIVEAFRTVEAHKPYEETVKEYELLEAKEKEDEIVEALKTLEAYKKSFEEAFKEAYKAEEEFKKAYKRLKDESEVYKIYEMENIEVVINGRDRDANGRPPIIIMGAHYDTVKYSPGANDNGSGVAAILEIARYMKQFEGKASKTLKLVLFPNEECPYSEDQATGRSFGPNMGSVKYAERAKENNDNIEVMIALDAIGCFDDTPGSQRYPKFPLSEWIFKWFGFPDKANFINFVSDLGSYFVLKKCSSCFNDGQDDFPLKNFSLPDTSFLPPLVGRSDHKSFWLNGFKAIMITDTANFRGDHYHKVTDTSENVNFPQLTRVVSHLKKMAVKLIEPIDASAPSSSNV